VAKSATQISTQLNTTQLSADISGARAICPKAHDTTWTFLALFNYYLIVEKLTRKNSAYFLDKTSISLMKMKFLAEIL